MTPEEFSAQYMAHFSQQQKAAVQAVNGAVLLLAVPGSGKTTVLVTRLGYLALCCGVDPGSILVMTYTVAATQELRARFAALFPQLSGRTPQFRTINGLSAKIIESCSRLRGPAFTLQENEGELAALVGRICLELHGEYPTDATVREIRTAITYCKNMMLGADEIRAQHFDVPGFFTIYTRYCQALRAARQMDYDDQMTYALAILRKHPDVLAQFQTQYPHLCVDESQDTSRVQHAIIRLLAEKTGDLFLVGDEDQSIYGFRAAWPEALLQFPQTYPGAKLLFMEENYRSTPQILQAANAFIAKNRSRYPKTIRPVRPAGQPVQQVHAASRQAQIRYLLALAAQVQEPPFTVLYRNNDSALPLIDALERAGLPYRCRSAEDTFFTHRIVCDVCDILRFASAPDDTERFLRIYYKFGAMISREAALAACAESARTHAPVLACLLAQGGLPDTCREAVEQLRARLDALPQTSGEALIRTIWGPMGYSRFVTERRLDPGKFSILCMLAAPQPSAAAFLARLDTLRQLIRTHRDAPDARLTLSTIHGSKGLEYDRVFLLDVHDGVLPADPNGTDGTEDAQRAYEEDRRLFYVAMTRAKNELYLFDYPDVPSAFVRELRQQLPRPFRPAEDFASILPENTCGLRYRHAVHGEGQILAQCGDAMLVAFADGDRCLQAGQMLLERDRTPDARTAPPSAQPLPPEAAACVPGSEIWHRKYGRGRIVSLQGTLAAIRFEAPGETAPRTFCLPAALQNGFLSFKTDAPG
ncbi:MAG: ATP-dependent helicase [Oscillospiraceae bacterium]